MWWDSYLVPALKGCIAARRDSYFCENLIFVRKQKNVPWDISCGCIALSCSSSLGVEFASAGNNCNETFTGKRVWAFITQIHGLGNNYSHCSWECFAASFIKKEHLVTRKSVFSLVLNYRAGHKPRCCFKGIGTKRVTPYTGLDLYHNNTV